MPPVVHILVLAAGASSRMRGRDKLLLSVKGRPLLRHSVDVASGTGAPVHVALPPDNTARRQVLTGSTAVQIEVPDADLGMSRSLVQGVRAIAAMASGAEDGIMVLPADMPGFSTKVLADLISRFRAEPDLIWRGSTVDGQPGHPIIFPRALWAELAGISGDEGGRSVLRRHGDLVRLVPLPGQMALLDLDTPEDWAAYQGRPLASS